MTVRQAETHSDNQL